MSCAELVLDVDTKTQRVILKKKVQLVYRDEPWLGLKVQMCFGLRNG